MFQWARAFGALMRPLRQAQDSCFRQAQDLCRLRLPARGERTVPGSIDTLFALGAGR